MFVFVCGISFFVFQNGPVYAKTVSSSVKQGIQAFNEKNYEQAKKHFIDAQLENPGNATLYYNIGAAAYMNKEYEQAQKNFIQAAKLEDIKLRHDVQYNLANTDYRMGKLEDAIKGYENILKEFPEDKEAKENLAFVKQKKQEQQQEKSKSDKDKDNKEKKEGQDKKEPGKDSEQDKDNSGDRKQPQDQQAFENQQKGKSEEIPSQPQENKTAVPEDKQLEQANQNQNMENMLNRVKDKPGKAMMPVLQKQYVEKDW